MRQTECNNGGERPLFPRYASSYISRFSRLTFRAITSFRSQWRRGYPSLLLAAGLSLIPSITFANPPYLPDEYFNTSDEALADCGVKRQWYQENYGHLSFFDCGWTNESSTMAKWAVEDYIFNGPTLVGLYRALYPKSPCPGKENFVAPGECTIPPPEATKNNGCSSDAMKGNPCNAATGNKFHREVDLTSVDGTIPIIRYYNSQLTIDVGFGAGWTSSILGKRLYIHANSVQILRADGRGEAFTCIGGACQGDADSRYTLTQDTGGYTLTVEKDGIVERYHTAGKLLTETDRNGRTTSYGYNTNGRLTSVTGPFGHRLTLSYTSSNHVYQIFNGAQLLTTYTYDARNNLTNVGYYGFGTAYHYENAAFPQNLTGITYNNPPYSFRYATFAYDETGKAVSTEHDSGAEKFGFSYDSPTQTTVTDAAGTQEVMTFATNLGAKLLVSKVNQSDGKSVAQTFDANNNLTCKKDEEGRITTYTYNSTNQKLSMTEGLTGTCMAPLTTSATRTTTYAYLSPTLNLPTIIQSPSVFAGHSKTTTIAYGDATHPTLPTTITQSGYTPAGTPVSRGVGFAYNSVGQITSMDGPRTDVNDVTNLAYYDCTTGGACGQLSSITNALGHVTTFDTYDAFGRLKQMTDANGLRTSYIYSASYDYQGRVTKITQTPPTGTARSIQYYYNKPGGDLKSVYLPDGHSFTYTYNNARQLTRAAENGGNYVTYDYDLKGNRTSEYTYNSANELMRQIDYAYDVRNRVASINAAGSLTQQINDAVGNLTQQTDPNNNPPTTNSFDALNRLIQTLNSLGGHTGYDYDVNDRLKQVVAPNDATTEYQYDDLGNLLQESSPDRGTTTYTYDSAGNVTTVTDARGVTTTYSYDALNRLTGIDYPGTAADITYTYDTCIAGIGRLCQVEDASGSTQYVYDAFGNIITQNRMELGIVYTTRYTYDTMDRVQTITYPDNRLITYTFNTLGQITTVKATVSGAAKTLASSRVYRPDRLLLSQTYGNGLKETRGYDLQGRLTSQSLGTADSRIYGYDANSNITSLQNTALTGSYGYDALDRLVQDSITSIPSSSVSLGYDANGNRTSDGNGTYIYLNASNRLTQRAGQSTTLDATGNTVNDGIYSYAYDNAGELQSVSQGTATLGSYVYNHQRQRTRKTAGSTTTVYHYDIRGNLILETDASGIPQAAYVWVDDQPLVQITKSGSTDTLSYLHTDHEGAPRLATSATKAVVWHWEGRAFGESAPTGSVTVNLRYPGQYADAETGLHYNWHRYYDPRMGRYVSSDPIGLRGGLNTYLYAAANPLRYIDPLGLDLTFGQQLIVNTAVGVGSAVGSLIPNPLGPLASGAAGGALAGGIATALIPGSTATDIKNNILTGAISGGSGTGLAALAEGIAANSGRAAALTGVFSGLLDAIGIQVSPPIKPPAKPCP
jgi:RHS repeat-associated protein